MNSLLMPQRGLVAPRKRLRLPPTFRALQEKVRAEIAGRRIARQIWGVIQEHYAGHRFSVEVVVEHRVIFIDHALLLEHTKPAVRWTLYNPDDDDKIRDACGEILERLGLNRGPNRYPERELEITREFVQNAFANRV